jgi:ribosome maturation factor RimP
LNQKEAQQMAKASIAKRVEEIVERSCIDHGLELYHAEVAGPEGKPILRVFIDKADGVTHDDCSAISLHVGTILDVEDFIHSPYTLEVSSPGLERGLFKREHYEAAVGEPAKVKSKVAVNGQRNFRGRIAGVDDKEVIFDDATSGRVKIPLDSIAKANLEIDVEAEFRRAREREMASKAIEG